MTSETDIKTHFFFCVIGAMGKKTELHEAAQLGESETLLRLLHSGLYDINEGNDNEYGVWRGRERKRRRKKWDDEFESGRES
jgi:hypothetical protein